MSDVERNTPVTSGTLAFKSAPGALITSNEEATAIIVSGALGVRYLSMLIEEATLLRDELREVVG